MAGRGIIILLVAASAGGAYALGFEVGPVLGYGTPEERNALKAREINLGVTTVDAGNGPIFGARAATTFAPFAADLAVSYMPTEATAGPAYETTRVEESTWRVTAAVKYVSARPPLKAGLELGYSRFDVLSETGREIEGGEWLTWDRCDYGGDVYRAAFVFEPALASWREKLGFRLALGPALSYVARKGITESKHPAREGAAIKRGDVVSEFYYGCGMDAVIAGRYGAALDFRIIHKLGELRNDYPADAGGGFYVTVRPYVNFKWR